MQIAVTGACGYVGSSLLPQLSPLADQIQLFDLREPSASLWASLPERHRYRFRRLDLTDPSACRTLIPACDVIIHLAGLVGYPACARDAAAALRLNVSTTENILRFKRRDAWMLLASTTSNYGDQTGVVDEKTPLSPNSVYGKTKREAEQLVMSEARNIIYRFSSAFGISPTMRHDNLIHDFVRTALSTRRLSVYEGHFTRQFIHIQDMTSAITFALSNYESMRGEIFNVGNPKLELTKRQVAETIQKSLRIPVAYEATGSDAEKRSYRVKFSKLLDRGFVPRRTLEPAIKELISYYSRESQGSPAVEVIGDFF